jgi:hypothetical protein
VKAARKCAYCGAGSNLTNEHVFPECFRKTFEAITAAKTPTGDKAIPSALEIHDVCARCNNGPLSKLDTYLCAINLEYFSKIAHAGDHVRFRYDVDLLFRMVLKIGYNVARARKWPLEEWRTAAPYIMGKTSCPVGFRLFLQLLIPTPVWKTTLPFSPGTTEIPPLPMRVNVADVTGLRGISLECALSVWSYRFSVLCEDMRFPRRIRSSSASKWLRRAKGACELDNRGIAQIYASSVDVLEDAKDSPTFAKQLTLARELKASMESKNRSRKNISSQL